MKLSHWMLTGATLLAGCGGVEEIALNPQASGGTATSASSGSGPMSPAGGTGSNTAGPGAGGALSSGGTPGSLEHGGSAGQSTNPPAQGGVGNVGCSNDGACPSDAAPHCRVDGRCVACLVDDDCPGDEPHCEVVSGSCMAVDCTSGGADAGGNCGDP